MNSHSNNIDSFDFLNEFLNRLIEDKDIRFYLKSKNEIIPLPLVNKRSGVLYHFTKKKTMQILKELEKRRLVTIFNFHGIRINLINSLSKIKYGSKNRR